MSAEGTLGSRIKECRKRAGLTQEELAEKLYLPKSNISGYENGMHMREDRLAEIARALFTTPNHLLGFEKLNPYIEKAVT